MSQQKAVNWLYNQLSAQSEQYNLPKNFKKLFDKAKIMERQQMKNAWLDGYSFDSSNKDFQEYYEKNYKK